MRTRYPQKCRRRIPTENKPFPTYALYGDYVHGTHAFVSRHSNPVRKIGKTKQCAPTREDFGAPPGGGKRYRVCGDPILTAKLLDAIRRSALRENSVYYFRHALVANEIYFSENNGADSRNSASPDSCGSPIGTSSSGKLHSPGFSSSVLTAQDSCIQSKTASHRPSKSDTGSGDYTAPARFSIGSACVEAFAHEMICEFPGFSGSTVVSKELYELWSMAFFLRRTVSTYARYAPRAYARDRAIEFPINNIYATANAISLAFLGG